MINTVDFALRGIDTADITLRASVEREIDNALLP